MAEAVAVDTDENGTPDKILTDPDEDGVTDSAGTDVDEDGKLDYYADPSTEWQCIATNPW